MLSPACGSHPATTEGQTCQAHANPVRNQEGFFHTQTAVFLNADYAPQLPLLPATQHFFPVVVILADNTHYYLLSLDNHTLMVPLAA